MKTLNEYINKNVRYYTFEDYCKDNNILEENINDRIHEEFVIKNWSIACHRPYYVYKSYIYESILKSYDSKKLYEEIVNKFKNYIVPSYYEYTDKASIKSIIIKYKNDDSFIKSNEFQKLLNLYNYFITYNDINLKVLHLEPNIPDNETEYIYNDCKGIVYHVTKKDIYNDKIKKFGLKPKTASYRIFPERVFVITGKDEKSIKDNIEFVIDILKDDPSYNENNICILKIDLNKYKNRITLYKDNGMENDSYWTSEYIPPYCLEEIKL